MRNVKIFQQELKIIAVIDLIVILNQI